MFVEPTGTYGMDVSVLLVVLGGMIAICLAVGGIAYSMAKCCKRSGRSHGDKEATPREAYGRNMSWETSTTPTSSAPTLYEDDMQIQDDEVRRRMAILMGDNSSPVYGREMFGQDQVGKKKRGRKGVALPVFFTDLKKWVKRSPGMGDVSGVRDAELSIVEPAPFPEQNQGSLASLSAPMRRTTSTGYDEPFQFASDIHSQVSIIRKSPPPGYVTDGGSGSP